MLAQDKIIRDIFTSDVILMDEEIEMLYSLDDSYFDKMEKIQELVNDGVVTLTQEQLDMLEKSFNDFYFEYAFVQFKRGLQLGLSLMRIH